MSKLTGIGLARFARTKLGTPYVYGAKGSYGKFTQGQLDALIKGYPSMFTKSYIKKAKKYVGQVCTDCSGLISWYTGKVIGSYQMYSTATKKGNIKDLDQAPIGAVLWRSGHVGVLVSRDTCIEAKSIDYGTVETKVSKTKFTHWLLFEDIMDYEDVTKNPYKEPVATLREGAKGDDVKWVQFELLASGITKVKVKGINKTLKVDGDYGPITKEAVRVFQQSCKIGVDGIVGPQTRSSLKNDGK